MSKARGILTPADCDFLDSVMNMPDESTPGSDVKDVKGKGKQKNTPASADVNANLDGNALMKLLQLAVRGGRPPIRFEERFDGYNVTDFIRKYEMYMTALNVKQEDCKGGGVRWCPTVRLSS